MRWAKLPSRTGGEVFRSMEFEVSFKERRHCRGRRRRVEKMSEESGHVDGT